MPNLDCNNRITIPVSFREKLAWELPKSVALCYEYDKNMLYISNTENSDDDFVLCFREVDSKGRFSLSKESLILLNASSDDYFIFLLKNNKIFIKKA